MTEQQPLEDLSAKTDESGLELEQPRGPEIEVPFDPTKIDIIVKPMTLSNLQDRLSNDELDLTPEFQRQANVWDAKRKSRLIESILLRIPLPSFYFSEDAEGKYAVVDGLQRLCAVFHFIDCAELVRTTGAKLEPLRLQGLQYLKELEGEPFVKLDRKFQRRISELEITANIIRANTPIAVKFNVFARLNQGGMPLNAQEIRNAIFPGKWRAKLRAMAESAEFMSATEKKIHRDRQQDIELVLRFVALWQLGFPYKRPPSKTLDEFLNGVVESVLANWSDEDWQAATNTFLHSLRTASAIFGRHVFRKSWGNYYRTPINRGLFEAQLIAVAGLSEQQAACVKQNAPSIVLKFGEAISKLGSEFGNALLYGTGSADSSNIRIKKMCEIVLEYANA